MGEVRSAALLLRTAFALMFALLAVRYAHADYRASYETAIKAMDFKDWSAAVEALQAAIQERPAEGGQVLIYGGRYKPYLPHYYLGVAYRSLGNCEAALREWKDSEGQGAVRKVAEYRTLVAYRTECETRVAAAGPKVGPAATAPPAVALALPTPEVKSPPPIATSVPKVAQRLEPSAPARETRLPTAVPPVEIARARREAAEEIERARGAANALATVRERPDTNPVWQADSAFRRDEDSARKSLGAAQETLRTSQARNDIAGLGRARRMAADATVQFNALKKSLTDRVVQARLQREKDDRASAAKGLEERRAEARGLLKKFAKPASSPQMRQARSDLDSLLTRAESASPDRPAEELRRLSDDLVGSMALLRRLAIPVQQPPAELLQGAAAFLRGDYARATQLLESKAFSDPRAAAQAHLFLAASRYSFYLLEGAVDSKLREQAVHDVQDCLRLDSTVALNARAFSPRFIEFFRKARGEETVR